MRPPWGVTDVPDRSTDVHLHERLMAGDEDALVEAFEQWSTLVHTLAVRITQDHDAAQDVTQDVFVHLWERPQAYSPERGSLRGWLCMLARSRALDAIRRRRARARYQASAASADLAAHRGSPDPDDALTLEQEAKTVREAVQALPDPQRDAVYLAYVEGHTYRQVAHDLNIPEGTAKSRLRQALASVAERLADEGLIER